MIYNVIGKKQHQRFFSSQRTEKIDTKKDQNGKRHPTKNTESIYRYVNTAVGIYQ